MKKTLMPALIVSATLFGCASPHIAPVKSFDRTQVVKGDYDRVWQNIVSHFATNGITIKTIAKDSGVIYAERGTFDDTMARCGDKLMYIERSRSGTFNVLVQRGATEQKVTVTSNFAFVGTFLGSPEIRPCESRGVIEQQIFNAARK